MRELGAWDTIRIEDNSFMSRAVLRLRVVVSLMPVTHNEPFRAREKLVAGNPYVGVRHDGTTILPWSHRPTGRPGGWVLRYGATLTEPNNDRYSKPYC